MLTQAQVIEAVQSGRGSQCLDGRDFSRLIGFFPVEQWKIFGFGPKEGMEPPPPNPWTEEAVLQQLACDVAFGFEKAYGERGISSSLMYETVKMWMWVLEDDLQNFSDYAPYGMPLFRAVAAKYGFPDPGE